MGLLNQLRSQMFIGALCVFDKVFDYVSILSDYLQREDLDLAKAVSLVGVGSDLFLISND